MLLIRASIPVAVFSEPVVFAVEGLEVRWRCCHCRWVENQGPVLRWRCCMSQWCCQERASPPVAVFAAPVVLLYSAWSPVAVL